MKLSECVFGVMVIDDSKRVGHVVGLTYNLSLINCGGLSDDDLFDRTVPLVKFPTGEIGIHHGNLKKFKG